MAPTTNRGKRPARRKRASLGARWRANFLTGLVVVAPVMLTIYLLWAVITFIDAKIVPLVPAIYNPSTYLEWDVPGFGVLVFLIFTAVVGSLTKNLFGRQLIHLAEGWVDRMPLVRSIYNALKQIIETVLSQSKTSFQQACLVEYPRKGLWAIAFVSTSAKGEINERCGEPGQDLMSVFLPTTPNPTSGFLIYVEETEAISLEMTVEEGAKMILTAGLVVPDFEPPAAADAASVAEPEVGTEKLAQQA